MMHRANLANRMTLLLGCGFSAAICAGISCRNGPAAPAFELRLAMDQDIVTVDPHQHDDSVTHSVLTNIYDPLVAFDREMKLRPALAMQWESPGDLVWRFHLRPNVRFHDGRLLTAADVKASLDRARRGKTAHYLAAVAEVIAFDDLTLEVRTSKPLPVLLNKMTVIGIVPADAPDPIRNPVGTGAYRVVRYEAGRFLELAANDDFWGGRPRIRRATFQALPDPEERVRALARGEIQLAREIKARDMAKLDPRLPVKLVSRPGLAVNFLGVNFRTKSPLLERSIREGIFWALDPQEIIREAGLTAAPIDQLVPPSIFGFLPEPDQSMRVRPDLAHATRLLKQAGYPEGFEIALEMSKAAANSTGQVIGRQLEKVGIRVRVVGLDWAELNSRLESQQSLFYMIGWSCSGDASDILEAVLHTPDGTYGRSNFGGYSNKELDRLIEEASDILQPNARLRILQGAMRLSLDELPLIPLYRRSRAYGAHSGLGFEPRQDGQVVLFELSPPG